MCVSWSVTLSCTVIALAVYFIYCKQRWANRFFADRGVSSDTPWPFFGNIFGLLVGRTTFQGLVTDIYRRSKSQGIFGYFYFGVPSFIVTDPESIQRITTSDYEHFIDHRFCVVDPDTEPLLGRSLFLLTGHRWRDMRTTFSQAFTGSKLRKMFALVQERCDEIMQWLNTEANNASPEPYVVEMKELAKRYMVDVIASTEFGYKVDSLKQPDNIFYTTAQATMLFHNGWSVLKVAIIEYLPNVCRWLGVRLSRPEHHRFYHHIVHGTIAYREQHSIVRPDMINLLSEARKGYIRYEEHILERGEAKENDDDEIGGEDMHRLQKRFWNEDDVTSQCYLFFFVGADNAATLLSFAAQELMENRHIQQRLVAEFDEATAGLKGAPMTYDVLSSLPYLEQVVLETMRKWPPVAYLERMCGKDYTLHVSQGHTVEMKQGDVISMPLFAIQRDAEHYPDPERFDPDRFSAQRKHTIKPSTFLSMGLGPRCCIGSRYAVMTMKGFMYSLLAAFTLDRCSSSQIPVRLESSGLLLKVKGGINVQLRPRHRNQ